MIKLYRFIFLFLTILSSCDLNAIARYRAIPLNYLVNTAKIFKGTVCFDYKALSACECKKFLGRSIIIKQGYRPIHITIVNNTNRHLHFSLNHFSLPCASYDDVAQDVCFNTTKRALAWGIPGLFIWPLLIPAFIEIVEAPKANTRLFMDYAHKALDNHIIEPLSIINGIVFIAQEHFEPSFSFTLIDKVGNEYFTLSTLNQTLTI